MTFDEKLAAAKGLLASKGISRRIYAPTVVTLLWRSGVEVPPPHFAGFWGLFLFSGSVFGAAWGILMWLAFWSRHGSPPSFAVGVSAFAGLLFGLTAAGYYRYAARKYSIPRWDSFPSSDNQRNRF